MRHCSVFLFVAILLGSTVAIAAADTESRWLALIIKDLNEEIESGCEYSFDDVSNRWIALTGAKFETWHFTACGNPVTFSVRYYPKDPPSGKDEIIEIERIISD